MSLPFVNMQPQYQALKNSIDENIRRVLDHCQFILGPEVHEVEKKLAEFVGCRHAITCGSGTDAALMALLAWDVGPGDEVILPAFSFIATAETVLLCGATPVYVDVNPETFNLDPNQLEQAITSKTKAIQPVSLYGQCADMDEINEIAKKHNLFVMEDAAQSFGAEYNGKRSCNLSEVACTSFFPAKPLGVFGDGGACFTNDDKKAEALKEIRVHGSQSRYHHTRLGINGRFDTIQAAVLLPKLERFSWEIEQRQRVAKNYTEAFSSLREKGVQTPRLGSNRTSVWAQYTLQVPERDKFQAAMKEKGIPTVVHYPCTMPNQPFYKGKGRVIEQKNSERAAKEVVSLPIYADIPDSDQSRVIEEVTSYFKN